MNIARAFKFFLILNRISIYCMMPKTIFLFTRSRAYDFNLIPLAVQSCLNKYMSFRNATVQSGSIPIKRLFWHNCPNTKQRWTIAQLFYGLSVVIARVPRQLVSFWPEYSIQISSCSNLLSCLVDIVPNSCVYI